MSFPRVRFTPLSVALCALLAYVVFYAVAFVHMYREPHSYEAASRWIFENVPAGSKLLGPHWDDRLPLTLPGLDAHRFDFEGPESELALYEADTPQKVALLARRVAAGDYIVFPTPRLQGSVPRVANEYPYTTAFFQLLWSENLGFKLVKVVKARPNLFGITFNDDLADESFSVYDHPKVTIFKNVERLSAREISARLYNTRPFEPLPSMNQILLADSAEDLAREGAAASSSIGQVLKVILIVELLAFSVWIVLFVPFRFASDRGLGASKCLGILLGAFLTWMLPALGVGSVTRSSAFVCASLLVVAAGWRVVTDGKLRKELLCCVARHGVYVQSLFWVVTGIFLTLRSYSPQVVGGEKPMDSTFLAFFMRNESFPPQDPWASGHPMSYYYFGSYVFGWLCKLTGTPIEFAYTISISVLAGLLVTALYSLLSSMKLSAWYAGAGALLIAVGSQFEPLRLYLLQGKAFGFDLFWSASRLLTFPSFAEHPLWSLTFADLHAHVMSLPFAAVFLMLVNGAVSVFRLHDEGRCVTQQRCLWALLGFVWGVLAVMNTWDFLTYGAILAVTCSLSLARGWRFSKSHVMQLGMCFLCLLGGAAMVLVPRCLGSSGTSSVPFLWPTWIKPTPGEPIYNTCIQLFWLWGHWTLLFVGGIAVSIVLAMHRSRREPIGVALIALTCLFAAGPGVLLLLDRAAGITDLPWQIPLLATCVIPLSLIIPWQGLDSEDSGPILQGAFIAVFLTLGWSETMIISDRMNTVFKTYSSLWIPLGVLAVVVAGRVLKDSLCCAAGPERSRLGTAPATQSGTRPASMNGKIFAVYVGSIAFLSLGSGVLITSAYLTDHRGPFASPTLDGQQFLTLGRSGEGKMIRWMNRNITGTPAMIEAGGTPYSSSARFATHTGLPSLIGWDHHVSQRGVSRDEIARRKSVLETIYNTTDADEAYRQLVGYGVELVIFGDLEKATYKADGLAKFENRRDLFSAIYRDGQYRIYATAFSPLFVATSPNAAPLFTPQ